MSGPIFVPVETALVLDATSWQIRAASPAWWLEMTDAGFDIDAPVLFWPTDRVMPALDAMERAPLP